MRQVLVMLGLTVALGAPRAPARSLLDDLDHTRTQADTVTRALAVATFDHDVPALRSAIDTLARLDDSRRAARQPPTGLDDEARLLAIALVPTAAARRQPLAQLLDDTTGDLHRLGRGLQASDAAARASRLLADDRHDRRAALINDAVRPFGLGTNLLAIVNPVLLAGSALDTVIATTRNVLRYDHLSTRERDALVSYHAAVARDAASERSPELARVTQRLTTKRRTTLCRRVLAESKAALEAGALADAATRLRSADAFAPCDTTGLRARLAAAERTAADALEQATWPSPEAALPRRADEEAAWRALAVALVDADASRIDTTAAALERLDEDGPLTPGARLARALAANLRGDRAEAREDLEDLADDDTPIGQYAAGALAGPGFGEGDALTAAERAHRARVARYVALGGVSGTSALQSAAHMAAYGASGVQSLGITNAIGVLTRAYRAWRSDPVPNDTIIARGEEYLVRHPHAADRDAVHERLAVAYERAQRYDRALLHLRATAAPDSDDIEQLEDDLAEQMLERARREDADPALLAAVATHFPSTDAAETARTALEKMGDFGGMALSREQLEHHLDLLGPDGLDLAPGLLDGDEHNGEIASDGIALRATELTLHLEGADAPRVDHRTLDAPAARRVYAAAETLLYREALARRDDVTERGRFEDYVPFFVTGTFGDSGVNMYPGVKLRPYDDAHPERYR
jgi:tetratricopeptide (TPR) repeat protein